MIGWVITALVILGMTYIVPGITVTSFWWALLAAILVGVFNFCIRPIALIITLPLNFLTLGLFTFVINALGIMLISAILPGFTVASFWWALLLGFVISIFRSVV